MRFSLSIQSLSHTLEGGSKACERIPEIVNKRTPDTPAWFRGTMPEALDFTLGPDESRSYAEW